MVILFELSPTLPASSNLFFDVIAMGKSELIFPDEVVAFRLNSEFFGRIRIISPELEPKFPLM